MRRGRTVREPRRLGQPGADGSALVLSLFFCLALAVLVLGAAASTQLGAGAIIAEQDGRRSLGEEDARLGGLALAAMESWGPGHVTLPDGSTATFESDALAPDWGLQATLASPWRGPSPGVPGSVTVRIERGRDGLDLPVAGLVAERLEASAGRSPYDLLRSMEAAPLLVGLRTPAEALASHVGLRLRQLTSVWRLDEGWVSGLRTGQAGSGLALSSPVVVLEGSPGQRVKVPDDLESGIDAPVLLVALGGADLDASELGEFHGVIVADGGDANLQGTQVYGAVCCTGVVDLGDTGSITFVRPTLRWATDRSLERVRLVPGTRVERLGVP